MRFDYLMLTRFCREVLMSTGMNEENAQRTAEFIIEADMRGIHSHGLTRLKTYYQRCKQGLIDPKASPEIVSEAPALILVDGRNAIGMVSADYAMRECIKRARTQGTCFAAVRGGNHFGCASNYANQAQKEGMIGLACANGPVAIPAIGGKEPVLGTSPLAISIPAEKGASLELDMATSIVARGKIKLAEKEGRSIPSDWAVDQNGNPTTDPKEVKYLRPFGGYKGFGIGLIIEVLCSCLSGAKNAMTMGSMYDFSGKKQDSGFFVGAVNTDSIMPHNDFAKAVDELFGRIKNSEKADGVSEIFIPGEIEEKNAKKAMLEGVEVSECLFEELKEVAEESGVQLG